MKEYDEYGFLQAVLEIPSVNGADDEGAVARFLCDFLRDCGVDSQVIPIDDSHADVIANIKGESEGFSGVKRSSRHSSLWET